MFSIEDLQAFLVEKGLSRVATLVGKYPDEVEPYLKKIEERLIAKGLLKKTDQPLTDKEGWTMLAALVDEALKEEPSAVREALKGAFLEEARKAA